MRVWLQKQKKKEETKAAEAKAASEAAATSAVEPAPAPAEVQAPVDAADKPVESVEEASRTEDGITGPSAAEHVAEGDPTSAAPQHEEVRSATTHRSGASDIRELSKLTFGRDPRQLRTRHSKRVARLRKMQKTRTRVSNLDKTRTTLKAQMDPMAKCFRMVA